MLQVKVEVMPSTRIDTAASEVVALARHLQQRITFEFNGVTLVALPIDTPEKVVKSYDEAMRERALARERERELRREAVALKVGTLVQTPVGLMRVHSILEHGDWIELRPVARGDDEQKGGGP